jgi:hypothetical protein
MRPRRLAAICFWLWLGAAAVAQTAAGKPTESPHIAGPHGLEGWTLDWPLPDDRDHGERHPFTLMIARRGHVIRRIKGGPLVGKWIFWADGRQVAYEEGSLHFNRVCTLVDVATGRKIASRNCFAEQLPAVSPAWEKALVAEELSIARP